MKPQSSRKTTPAPGRPAPWRLLAIGVVFAGALWMLVSSRGAPPPAVSPDAAAVPASTTPPVMPAAPPDQTLSDADRRMFEGYVTSRAWTRPALVEILARDVLPLLAPGATVLEIGAGTGELYELANVAAPKTMKLSEMQWTESDKVSDFIRQPRRFSGTSKLVTALPDLGQVRDGSVSHVIGLAVFPVIPVSDYPASLASIARVLRPGGLVVHIDDLGLSFEAEAHHASKENLVPVPYFEGETEDALMRPMHIAYASRAKIQAALQPGGVVRTRGSRDEQALAAALLQEPVRLIQSLRLTRLYALKRLLESFGVLEPSRDVVAHELALKRLSDAARAAGLEVVTAEERTAEVSALRGDIVNLPAEVAVVKRRYAAQIDGAGVKTEKVQVSTTVGLFVARKAS